MHAKPLLEYVFIIIQRYVDMRAHTHHSLPTLSLQPRIREPQRDLSDERGAAPGSDVFTEAREGSGGASKRKFTWASSYRAPFAKLSSAPSTSSMRGNSLVVLTFYFYFGEVS